MVASGDLYKVLQVDPEAEREVIRAAYRTLALKHHPDLSAGSHDRMAALNHAWGILRSVSARAAYDQARAEARRTPEVQRKPGVPKPEQPKPVASDEIRAPLPAAPPGTPSGSVLDFGRYAGWSLGQIATADPVYLEWLARTPIGRSFNREIDALLATHRAASEAAAAATAERRPRRSRRN
jgi:curved DNA-binding protein CbpA